MRARRTPRGPFVEQPYFTDSDIEALCIEELASKDLLPRVPGPVRIDRFIEKRWSAHEYDDLPDEVLGLTRFGASGVQKIVLQRSLENDATKPAERRLRSTFAHEAGHGLLHAHLFALGQIKPLLGDWSDVNAPKVLCREAGLRSAYKGDWWEYQANMVMRAILMPKPLVIAAVQPYLEQVGTFGITELTEAGRERAASGLADVFDVNPALARIRMSKLFPPRQGTQGLF